MVWWVEWNVCGWRRRRETSSGKGSARRGASLQKRQVSCVLCIVEKGLERTEVASDWSLSSSRTSSRKASANGSSQRAKW